jgi:hypothetical protein
VPGAVLHHWHGPKENRGYKERWAPLLMHQYKPSDLTRDADGLIHLKDPDSPLGLDLRAHFEKTASSDRL